MSATNSATLSVKISPNVFAGVYPFATSVNPWAPGNLSFFSGTSAGQIDQVYLAQVQATTSGASVQLQGGGLTDPVGDSFSPARVDGWGFANTGTNSVWLSGHAFIGSYTATSSFQIPLLPGGYFLHVPGTSSTGLAVGSGTNSVVTLTSLAGTSSVQICSLGRSV